MGPVLCGGGGEWVGAVCICIVYMYTVYVHCICILYLYIDCICMLYMYTVYVCCMYAHMYTRQYALNHVATHLGLGECGTQWEGVCVLPPLGRDLCSAHWHSSGGILFQPQRGTAAACWYIF